MPKLFIFFPPFLEFFIWEILTADPRDVEEVEDHLCLFLFHSHFFIPLPCCRSRKHKHHLVLSFFSFFIFEFFLGHSQHFRHSMYLIFQYSLFAIARWIWIERKIKIRFEKFYFWFLEVVAIFANFEQINSLCPIYYSIHQFVHLDFWFFLITDGESEREINWIWTRVYGDSDRNGDDTASGFPLSKPLVFKPLTRRYVTRASLDKGKSKMCVPQKLLVKRKWVISV